MERNQRSEWARGFEGLEVFRRAYRVSLEVHRASLEFPAIEQRALGSADEMQVWTIYCRDLGYLDERTTDRWRGEYQEIARMLTGLHRGSSDL
jgi:hypothetical protein